MTFTLEHSFYYSFIIETIVSSVPYAEVVRGSTCTRASSRVLADLLALYFISVSIGAFLMQLLVVGLLIAGQVSGRYILLS